MPYDASTREAFQQAMDEILALTINADTDEEAERWQRVADELGAARRRQIQSDFAARTFAYNFIASRLGAVCAELTRDPLRDAKRRLQARLLEYRTRAMEGAIELVDAFQGLELPADLDAALADPAAIVPAQSPRTEEPDSEDVPAAEPPADAPQLASGAASAVRDDLREDYESLFATCVTRPDRLGSVNWHLGKLAASRERYEAAGADVGVPWWFVGVVHCMECGFDFDRHLHNGDPLDAKTTHVPKDRPALDRWDWQASALDALRFERLDAWDDWSVPGALYQWERYNGFGYRRFHPETRSPYLWSFSNHYTSGKYVADGEWSADAVSRQCGAATMLREMVNRGLVVI